MFKAEAKSKAKASRPRPNFEAQAEAKILASRPLWPRGLNSTGMTMMRLTNRYLLT